MWNLIMAYFIIKPFEGAPDIFISVPGSTYQPQNKWYYHFNYLQEKYRGLDYEEDLFNHGLFTVHLEDGDSLNIIISTENPTGKNPDTLFETEKNRKLSLIKTVTGDPFTTIGSGSRSICCKS